MSCTVTEDGPCRRVLSFEVERARLDQAIEDGIREVAGSVNLKGFRKGKAPVALIRKSHGPRVAEEARRRIMGEEFSAAVKEHSLRPVGDPEMNLEKLDAEGPGAFTFEFAVEIAPEFELDLPEEIPVTVALAEVTDEMVDGEVVRFREQAASLEDAEEGAAVAQDDILEGTAVYEVDGTPLEPREDRAVFTKHDLVDSIKVEGSAQRFIGRKKGDSVTLDVTLPPHFAPNEHAGKDAKITFTIERHRLVILPELDEEFLGRLGVKTEEEMRARIREELERQRRAARVRMVDERIEEVLHERHDFELPPRLLDKAIDGRVHEFAHRLMKERGLEAEEGHHQAEERRDEIAEATSKGMRLAFVLGKIAELHQLEPSAEETLEQVRNMALAQQQDPDEAVEAARREGWISEVYEQLVHTNARAWLRNLAQVTETEPQPPEEEGSSGTLEDAKGA